MMEYPTRHLIGIFLGIHTCTHLNAHVYTRKVTCQIFHGIPLKSIVQLNLVVSIGLHQQYKAISAKGL